jgi:hypothetical protein
VHEFNAGEDDARAAEILKARYRPDDPFDGAVALLDDVVEVFDLSNLDRLLPL